MPIKPVLSHPDYQNSVHRLGKHVCCWQEFFITIISFITNKQDKWWKQIQMKNEPGSHIVYFLPDFDQFLNQGIQN